MIKIDLQTAEIGQLEAKLHALNKYGLPNATREALSAAAADTIRGSKGAVKKAFTLRNQYTLGSMRVTRATGRRIDDMKSEAGSIQEYMQKQDEGFVKTGSGKHGAMIPSPGAAEESGKKRTRVISSKNWRSNIKNIQRVKVTGANGKQRLIVAVKKSLNTNNRVIFIHGENWRTGFYSILGGGPEAYKGHGWPDGVKFKSLYVMRQNAKTKATPWLEPSAQKAAGRMDRHYRKALIRWINRGAFRR